MAPPLIPLVAGNPAWPLGHAARTGEPVLLDDLARRFHDLGAGPANLVCQHALVVPLRDPGTDTTSGFVVLGVFPRLPLDAA